MRQVIRWVLISLISLNVLYAFSGVIHYPLQSIDAFGIWLFKAKAMYVDRGLPVSALQNPDYYFSHPQYPLLLPALVYFGYQLMGGVNEPVVLLVWPVIYAAILWLTYKLVRSRGYSTVGALLITYLYSLLSPLLTQAGRTGAGTADIVLVLLTWIMLTLIYRPKTNPWWIVLLVIVASQIKAEGVMLVTFLGFLEVPVKKKVAMISVSLLPFLIWQMAVVQLHFFVSYHFVLPNLGEVLSRSVTVVRLTIIEMLNFKNWYLFWPVCGLSLFIKSPLSKTTRRTVIPVLLIMIIGYWVAYVFTNLNVDQHVSSSVDRVLLQLSPLLVMIVIEKIGPVVKSGI